VVLRPLQANACKNNGTCTDANYDYVCQCPVEWGAKDCSAPATPSPTGAPTPPPPRLFFTRYVDGYGGEKQLEIYNPGPGDANLTSYRLYVARDGAPWGEAQVIELDGGGDGDGGLLLESSLIVCDAGSAQAATGCDVVASGPGGAPLWDGDDAVGLLFSPQVPGQLQELQNSGEVGQVEGLGELEKWGLVDTIGQAGMAPGNGGWPVGTEETATRLHTLVLSACYLLCSSLPSCSISAAYLLGGACGPLCGVLCDFVM